MIIRQCLRLCFLCGFTAAARRKKRANEVRRVKIEPARGRTPPASSPTAHARELSNPPREGIVLVDDVFYGRPIIRLPRAEGLLGHRTLLDAELRLAIENFPKRAVEVYNITNPNLIHLLQTGVALVAENRNASSRFRSWLDHERVKNARLPMLQMSPDQERFLTGTTVETAVGEVREMIRYLYESSGNFSLPSILGGNSTESCAGSSGSDTCTLDLVEEDRGATTGSPMSLAEAEWVTSVVLEHSRTVWPSEEDRLAHVPMQIVPLVELLDANFHPDASVAITFQEERIVIDGLERDVVLQVARRDMAEGEENYLWPGRFSNSDLLLRFNFTFKRNHVGIGDNMTAPGRMLLALESGNIDERGRKSQKEDLSQKGKMARELGRFNCSSAEVFELRFTAKGRPLPKLARCWRVHWFLQSGWYHPGLARPDKIRDMFDRWPPPRKYDDPDLWLPMTQSDNDFANMLLEHCEFQRQRLRDGVTRSELEAFKTSSDSWDKKLWGLRVEESNTWKGCIQHVKEFKARR